MLKGGMSRPKQGNVRKFTSTILVLNSVTNLIGVTTIALHGWLTGRLVQEGVQ